MFLLLVLNCSLHRQGRGLNSLLQMSTYAGGGAGKEKRIGVPFAPSLHVSISVPFNSLLNPFSNSAISSEIGKDGVLLNVRSKA
jgi:hypothetical protein